MGVASLVLGILGVVVFCWLGPTLGGIWAVGLSATKQQVVTWPVWAVGLGMGVGIPMVSVILGIGGLAKSEHKGVPLCGLVAGVVSAIAGVIITAVIALGGGALAEQAGVPTEDDALQQKNMDELKESLDDPDLQQMLQNRLKTAPKEPTMPVAPPPAPPTPGAPQPDPATNP